MEFYITVRSLLPGRPKAGESGPRTESSIRTAHAHSDSPHALALRRPSGRRLATAKPARPRPTPAYRARPPAGCDVVRRPSPPPPPPNPAPGGRFRPRVRACAPAAATAAARGSLRRETWCCRLGAKVLSNFRFLFLSPAFLKSIEEDGERVRGGEYRGRGPWPRGSGEKEQSRLRP